MKKIIIGIDTNLRSTAWAVIKEKDGQLKLEKAGFVKQKGSELTNQNRRENKSIRTQKKRKVSRKKNVLHFCIDKKLVQFPKKNLHKNLQKISTLSKKKLQEANEPFLFELKAFINLPTWQLRIKAIEGEKLTSKQLTRVFYQLAMRRGFPENSFRSQDSATTIRTGDKKEGAQGAKPTLEYLKEQPHTYYAYLAKLLPEERKPYQDLEKKGQHRARNRYTYRSVYEAEFHHIWDQQAKHHPSLTPKDKKTLHHYLFYQLPLKPPQKGFCTLEPQRKRTLKSSLLFEEFRTYLFANNFVTSLKNKPAGDEAFIELRDRIVDILQTSYKNPANQAKTSKDKKEIFTISKLKEQANISYYTSYDLNRKVPAEMPIISQLIHIFGKKRWQQDFTQKERHDIWHLVCQEENHEKQLNQLAIKYDLDQEATQKLQKDFNIPLSSQGVAKYSTKALKKLLPYLQEGYTEDKATLLAGIPTTFITKNQEGKITNHWSNFSTEKQKAIIEEVKNLIYLKPDKLYQAYQTLLSTHYPGQVTFNNPYNNPYYLTEGQEDKPIQTNNPDVDSSLNLTKKVIRSLQKEYPTLDQINIEMARVTRQSDEARKEETYRNICAQNYHDMAIWDLQHNHIPVTKNNLLKYKLWKECGEKCVYSGKSIPIHKVFRTKEDDKDSVEIEHIIPHKLGKPADSRFINLTLSYRRENAKKGEETPYEAFYNKENPTKWEEIQQRAKCFPKFKRERLLAEEKRPDEPFLKGTADLTGYISKETAKMAKPYTKKVLFTKGGVVSQLREAWHLDELLSPPLKMAPATPEGMGILVYTEKAWSPDRVLPEREIHFFEPYQPAFQGRDLKEIKNDLYLAQFDQ